MCDITKTSQIMCDKRDDALHGLTIAWHHHVFRVLWYEGYVLQPFSRQAGLSCIYGCEINFSECERSKPCDVTYMTLSACIFVWWLFIHIYVHDQSMRQGKARQLFQRQLLFSKRKKKELPQAGLKHTTFCIQGRRSTSWVTEAARLGRPNFLMLCNAKGVSSLLKSVTLHMHVHVLLTRLTIIYMYISICNVHVHVRVPRHCVKQCFLNSMQGINYKAFAFVLNVRET